MYVIAGEKYIEPGAIAHDDVDGNVTDRILRDGIVNTNVVGEYTVKYKVSDKAGNITRKARRVYVSARTGATSGSSTDIAETSDTSNTDGTVGTVVEDTDISTKPIILEIEDPAINETPRVFFEVRKDGVYIKEGDMVAGEVLFLGTVPYANDVSFVIVNKENLEQKRIGDTRRLDIAPNTWRYLWDSSDYPDGAYRPVSPWPVVAHPRSV